MKAESQNPLFECSQVQRQQVQRSPMPSAQMLHARQGSDRASLMKPGSLRTRLKTYMRAIQRLNEPKHHRRSSTFTAIFGGLSGSGIDHNEKVQEEDGNRGYDIDLENASSVAYASETESSAKQHHRRSPTTEFARKSLGFLRRRQSTIGDSNSVEEESKRARGVVGAVAMGEDSDEERALVALLVDDPMVENDWESDSDDEYDEEIAKYNVASVGAQSASLEISSTAQPSSSTPMVHDENYDADSEDLNQVLEYDVKGKHVENQGDEKEDVEEDLVERQDVNIHKVDSGNKLEISQQGEDAVSLPTEEEERGLRLADDVSGIQLESNSDAEDNVDMKFDTTTEEVESESEGDSSSDEESAHKNEHLPDAPVVLYVDQADSSDEESEELMEIRYPSSSTVVHRATPKLVHHHTVRITPSLPEIEKLLDLEAEREQGIHETWDDPMLDDGFDLDEASCPIVAVQFMGSDSSLTDIVEEESEEDIQADEADAEPANSKEEEDNRLDWDKWWDWVLSKWSSSNGDWDMDNIDIPLSVCRATHTNSALNENTDRALFRAMVWSDAYEDFDDDGVTVATSRSTGLLSRLSSSGEISRDEPVMMVGHIPDTDSEDEEELMNDIDEVIAHDEVSAAPEDDPIFDSLRLGSAYSISIGSLTTDQSSKDSVGSSEDGSRRGSEGSKSGSTGSGKGSRRVSFCTKPVVLVSYEYQSEEESDDVLLRKQMEYQAEHESRWSENPKYGTEEYGLDGWV